VLTRRAFTAAALGAATAASGRGQANTMLPTRVGGVRTGVCLYNFRDLPRLPDAMAYLDSMIDACVQVGIGLVEINSTYIEPVSRLPFAGIPRIWDAPLVGPQRDAFAQLTPQQVQAERERLRFWRLSTPPSHFAAIRRKFVAAGLEPLSYVITFTPDMTDPEIDAIFRQARALGVRLFSTNQTKVEMAPRLALFADRYAIDLGFHNHTATGNPNEVASRDSLERLFSVSPRCKVNLDLGHFTAADQDEMALLDDHFDRITHFHIKDRKRHLGPNVSWGEGDSPIASILLAIRERRSDTPAVIEYEYRGSGGSVAETRRCLAYMQRILA
jgi:sugar phosphate isomerase/epimerase